MKEICIREEHIVLMQNLYIEHNDRMEFGALGADCKRPYGNSDVLSDMRQLLVENGVDQGQLDDGDLIQLHEELVWVLQISIQHLTWDLVGKTFQKERGYHFPDWKLVKTETQ